MPTILITGANRGLGLEFARQYAEDGWTVIACCREPANADELQALAAANDAVTVEQLDVTDFAQIEVLGAKYTGVPIDILLNNAGIIGPLPIAENIERQNPSLEDRFVFDRIEGGISFPASFVQSLKQGL